MDLHPKGQLNRPLSAPDCCPALRETIRAGTLYDVVYDEAGATIAEPRTSGDQYFRVPKYC